MMIEMKKPSPWIKSAHCWKIRIDSSESCKTCSAISFKMFEVSSFHQLRRNGTSRSFYIPYYKAKKLYGITKEAMKNRTKQVWQEIGEYSFKNRFTNTFTNTSNTSWKIDEVLASLLENYQHKSELHVSMYWCKWCWEIQQSKSL